MVYVKKMRTAGNSCAKMYHVQHRAGSAFQTGFVKNGAAYPMPTAQVRKTFANFMACTETGGVTLNVLNPIQTVIRSVSQSLI